MLVDSFIIKGSIDKDEKACKLLYNQCIPYVYSLVKRYIWVDDQRKDVCQEIFASVFKNLKKFNEHKGSFNSWIRKISINHCLMQIRKNSRQASIIPIQKAEENRCYEELDVHLLTKEDVDKILVKMPIGYRTIFLLVVIDEYSHVEVSELLNISRETSRSQLSRAKRWVRKYFLSEKNVKADGYF